MNQASTKPVLSISETGPSRTTIDSDSGRAVRRTADRNDNPGGTSKN